MNNRISSFFFAVLFMLAGSAVFAQHNATAGNIEKKEEAFNAKEVIMEHISDANEWHIATLDEGKPGERHISVPLPIIIKDRDGLHTFLSSSIGHGHSKDGYTMDHGVVVSEKGLERASLFGLIGGKQKAADAFFDFSITKNVLAMLLSALVMVLIFVGTARSYKNGVPTGIGKFMEPLVVFIRDEVAIPNIGTRKYKKFLPYLLTAFFFIWLNNLMGLIPFFPGGANLTGNIAVTAVLAIITLLITTFSANKDYWKHIFMPPVPYLLYPIMVPIEIIGIFTKPFALMMRLFANVTAGHIMILAIISLIFIFKSAFLGLASVPLALFVSVLELLVAALQAYIFTVLSALFIGIAVADHHHEDGHSAHPELDTAGDDAAVI